MTFFNILSLADFMTPEEIDTVLESFSEFYFQLTSKHQRRIRLYMIAGEVGHIHIRESAERYKLQDLIEVVSSDDEKVIRNVYQAASVLFLPLQESIGEIIPEALAFGLPVLCYDTEDMREYLDQTCGMFVRPRTFAQSILAFTEKIHMLYFDPEARKLLKKGAKRKFGLTFGWNRYEGIEVGAGN
ncbi:MAG: glycosyltransferase [Bacteroidota bacterium]